MRKTEWLVTDSDGDTVTTVWGATFEDASAAAIEELGATPDDDYVIEPVTDRIRRDWRNARRRERYAETEHPSRRKPDQPELPMHVYMAAIDDAGRLRCASGHFTTADKLVRSPASMSGPGIHVSFSPTCSDCRIKQEAST